MKVREIANIFAGNHVNEDITVLSTGCEGLCLPRQDAPALSGNKLKLLSRQIRLQL